MPPRTLLPGQRSEIWVLDVDTGEKRLRWSSSDLLVEAPNWTHDGWLVVNGGGRLLRLTADGDDEPEVIETPGLDDLNNDHVLDPDGLHVFVSNSADKHIHRVPLPGVEGVPVRMTADDEGLFHFLHGVSPDGAELAWIGLRLVDGAVLTNIICSATTPADGLEISPGYRAITDDQYPDDGSEYSPDGAWLWFNSERGSSSPGHAQVFRTPLAPSAGQPGEHQQLTFDERVNWFPHLSPDGARVVYISFPQGTLGHPENKQVVLRELVGDLGSGEYRDLVWLFGGQGTINVNSWAPDSRRIAYVAYPVDEA